MCIRDRYYLVNLENVTKAKVYERTQDAVIYYEKDRREIIKALQKFGYDRVDVYKRQGHI